MGLISTIFSNVKNMKKAKQYRNMGKEGLLALNDDDFYDAIVCICEDAVYDIQAPTLQEEQIIVYSAGAVCTGIFYRDVIMRIDKFLKVSRLIKRRTVANEVADAGRIIVNGREVKASYQVKIGDEVQIMFGTKPVKVKVLSVENTVSKDGAREMYTVIEE